MLAFIVELLLKGNFSTAYSKKEFISQGLLLEEFLWTDI